MMPPQHYSPPFTPEYRSMSLMMMVEQQQDSHNHTRPVRFVKDASALQHLRNQRNHNNHDDLQHSEQQEQPMMLSLPPPPQEHQSQSIDREDPEPLLAIPGPDIIVSSDDHPISMVENLNLVQERTHVHLTYRTRQSQSLQGQAVSQTTRPQRQRRAAANSTGGNAMVRALSPIPAIANQSTNHCSAIESKLQPESTPPQTFALPTHQPSTHSVNDDTEHSEQKVQCQGGVDGGVVPLSNLLNSTDLIKSDQVESSESIINTESESITKENEDKPPNSPLPQQQDSKEQEQEQKGSRDDSQEEQLASGSEGLEPNHKSITQLPTGNAQEDIESQPEHTVGAGVKRGCRQMNSTNTSVSSTGKTTKDSSLMPAKKKIKTEVSKKSENDTASLFQKIFADRDPGKRKIKTKSVHEIPMELAADEDDSDFEDTKDGSNDEDEDMIIPDDAASEDEIRPEQEEAFNDEQDLLTALWQWKDNDPEVCCVCLGRSTEADNVFVYCDTLDCALCVHQACYGVKTLPSESEPWLCDRCKAPPEEVVSCVCCPSKDGAFRRLIPEDPSGGWVHVVCALWLPETTLGDPENVDKISVRDIPEKNWNMTCYMCNDPQDAAMGACVQCDAGQCRKSFHITCAQGYSLLETVEETDMADPYFMYCKQHGATDGHPKLNGWLKWVKQKDAFLKKWQDEQGRKRTLKLLEMQRASNDGEDEDEGIIELFEHSYSRFKQARERRIARERSELSRQHSIGYYLNSKIDKSKSRLEAISSKAQQAQLEQRRIEMHTRNLLSSLLECANYLENLSAEQLEAPLSIDTTLAWYNSLPDTSRWKSNIQDIIETIDIESLPCDNPYTQPGSQSNIDSGIDDSEGGQRHGRSSKGSYGKLSMRSNQFYTAGKNAKSKKVYPKPTPTNRGQLPVVFTSSRGRMIKRDFSDLDDSYASVKGADYQVGQSNGMAGVKLPRSVEPCAVCHQLTLPEEKLDLERDSNGYLSPMSIKVLNRMVSCDSCQRQFHPKCLDPPMARVPPRGYSWNCEECDSSEESQESSDESSPSPSDHQHQHNLSSDLDEALMVLADTAMTMSANPADYQSAAQSRVPKRPHGVHGSESLTSEDVAVKGKESKVKKMKTEASEKNKASKPKIKATVLDMDAKSKTKKATKVKAMSSVASYPIQSSMTQMQFTASQMVSKPAVAPIIRGNLRIYPPGPHITPKASNVLLNEVAAVADTKEVAITEKSPKTMSKKTTMTKAITSKKHGVSTDMLKVAKVKSVDKIHIVKSKKTETTVASPKGIKSKTAVIAAKKQNATVEPTSTTSPSSSSTKVAKGTKEKATVHRGALPAVPVPPPPKPKEVIRYTVGEKTVEELQARDDVEIERRENVKFRKLRGRTLTMPAPPHEVLANAAFLAAATANAN
ncbi:PHD finger protein 14 [Lobosporangium transversale]|uniref:PHD-zinc-finger like domain-domain-containing protein n=1 Tax=Lobosporangium transversale TaxID=64571 RepID=A0A1Y2GZD6_9FUNG|nr:hypothetical protein BCR41DRAFT_383416 [Lobosporangium transversale]KAF9908074.1 PHD finger protein 14 [Lobosporangium transversale]ORZ27667.1 hypothetical protein BCR41DRAFT_383416 [Lobosporangium transversale]|eukprot:XP_021885370.1 hypothetical protein BCR41DRAFT_383416 [Lobosporangium transversale]